MRIGLFGGTFDPPHIGHLIVAQDALVRLTLDRVVFIPAAQPPHKRDRTISPAPLRLEMLEAAVETEPAFAVDDIELHRSGPSYTVDTLRAYRERFPDEELFLLLGADQYAEIDTWHEAGALGTLAHLVVLSRSGERKPAGARVGAAPLFVDVTRIDVSATEIRRRVAAGEAIRFLVTDPVAAVIGERGLYARPHARTGAYSTG